MLRRTPQPAPSATVTGVGRRLRYVHVLLCMAGIAAYCFVPSHVQDALYLGSSAAVVVAVWWGLRQNRPTIRTPWVLIVAATGCYFIGDATSTALSYALGDAVPFPSVADAAYLAFFPLMFVALGRFLTSMGNPDRAAWVDAWIWTVGVAALLWEPLIEPYVVDSGAGAAAYAAAMAYPLLDLGLLLIILRMVAGRSSLHPAYVLLSSAMMIQVGVDFIYGVRVVEGVYVAGEPTDLGWQLINLLIGMCALHPSMVRLTLPVTRPAALASRRRLQALLAPAMVAPALLLLLSWWGEVDVVDDVFAAGATAVILVFIVIRGRGLLAVAEVRSDQLRDRTDSLEAALAKGEQASLELRTRVDHDTLTGLASRDLFVEVLKDHVAQWQAGGTAPSVAFLDLDDFKNVNDTLGHDAGDLLLIEVGRRLRGALDAEHLVARFGGDEFAILVPSDAEAAAERLLGVLRPPVLINGRELRPEVSIGLTTASGERCSSGDILREADVAMYAAKRAGGGWTRYQTGMSAVLLERLDLHARLVEALDSGEIVPWFQPVVDLATGELRGFEALARWCRPGQAVLSPAAWFALAEETGLVAGVDRVILNSAVTQLAAWRLTSPTELHCAVNLSGRTLQQHGIEDEVLDALRSRGVPPECLVVEVTEGVLIDDELVGQRLQRLRAAGVRIALDDFGTGWSSLSYLRRFPVDQIKLDQTFTAELGLVAGADAIPAAVIQLARGLGLDAIAEGVETRDQQRRLYAHGFRSAQGYLFGHAQPAEDFDDAVGVATHVRGAAVGAAVAAVPV